MEQNQNNLHDAGQTGSTFEKTIQSYLDIISTTLQPGSVRNYKGSIKMFVGFLTLNYPEVTKFSELKRSPHIEGWLSFLAKRGLKNATRRLYIRFIRKFLNDMYEWGWDDAPPPGLITHKDFPIQDKYLPKPLTPEDDKKLSETLKSKNTLSAQALLLLRKTGMRVGELRDLPLDCLEKLPDNQYVLHVPLGKLHTERIIPVDSETVEIVNRIIKLRGNFLPIPNPRTGKPTQFLIVRRNCWKRYSYAGLRHALSTTVKNCNINKHISLHQLRHSFATELLRGGINLAALMKLLGHKDINMTLRYTGVSMPDIRREYFNAVEKSESIHLLSEQSPKSGTDKPDILDSIDSLITKIHCIRKDSTEKKFKLKLQRIAERLRRAFNDFKKCVE
ncbi:MAG: tyrosine-type recombinase/integrase [Elusimicrobiota bacterium]|nr:tyrosine-type recombinase/integrase [Elusimicrobiota bacterium]